MAVRTDRMEFAHLLVVLNCRKSYKHTHCRQRTHGAIVGRCPCGFRADFALDYETGVKRADKRWVITLITCANRTRSRLWEFGWIWQTRCTWHQPHCAWLDVQCECANGQSKSNANRVVPCVHVQVAECRNYTNTHTQSMAIVSSQDVCADL